MTVLQCDPSQKSQRESNNAVDQIDFITYLITRYRVAHLQESHITTLHRLAVAGIYPCGGRYRRAIDQIYIHDSDHTPPPAALVPSLIYDMLHWVNKRLAEVPRDEAVPYECAAYAMWRLNWIHPFCGANGRTARAVAYLVICMAAGTMLPGTRAMPDLICDRRDDYITALRDIDRSERQTPDAPNITPMLRLVLEVTITQLQNEMDRLGRGG